MNERELELIAQLAQGELSGDRLAEAEALVASRPELAEELGLQRRALDAIASDSPPLLTELEAVRMRRNVADALGLAEPEPEPKRAFGWLAPALVAAVVVAIFAIGPLIGSLSTGGDAGADVAATTIARQSSETTVAASDDAAEAAPEPTEAPAADESLLSARLNVGGEVLDLGAVTEEDLDRFADEIAGATTDAASATTSTVAAEEGDDGAGGLGFTYSAEAVDCVDRYAAANDASPVTPVATATLNGAPVVVVIETRDGAPRLLAIDEEDCSVVYGED